MKNASRFCALALTFAFALAPTASAQNAAAYLVVDANTGHVFQGASVNKKLQIGSLTKIATGMVVLDWLELRKGDVSQFATVPDSAATVAGQNSIGLQPGDRVSLRDLLYAALMQSDNIAALTLADHVGQTQQSASEKATPVDKFVAQMNALARRLEMKSTLFVNPHGIDLHERKLPYSTAADLAKLTRYAMAKSAFRFYVSQKERRIEIARADGTRSGYSLQNTNEMLGQESIDGVKTGTTQRAGQCVILSAARPPQSVQQGEKYVITPRRLIVVALGANPRFQFAASLLRSGWASHDRWTAAGRPVGRE